ncbi:MAG: hypothetical protein JNL39_09255 [Opitutaceae bacterium]|nr:hypothetical protein [Opitutaceae bacterium]
MDDLSKLEAELRSLRPAPVSTALTARIARDLAAAAPPRREAPLHWFWAIALPAAAAVVAMLLQVLPERRAESSLAAALRPAEAQLKPVAAENVLVSVRDEGLVTLDDGSPARRERLRYVDTIQWRNPRTNASLIWTVPREEVRVVPVVFQ